MDLSAESHLDLPRLEDRALSAQRVDGFAPVAGLAVEAYGVRLGVHVDNASLLARLADYLPYSALPITQTSPVVQRLFSIRTHPADEWPALFIDGKQFFTIPELEYVLRVFEIEAKSFVAELAPHHVFVHAATLAWEGRAVVIPGGSFSGKTTLAAALVRTGALYYSDEYAVIDEKGLVHPYPRPLGLREPGGTVHQWSHVEDLGGRAGTEPIPIGFVISAPYVGSAQWKAKRISTAHGLAVLLANTRSVLRRPESVLDILERAAGGAVMLECERGDADETAALIVMYLRRRWRAGNEEHFEDFGSVERCQGGS